MMLPTQNLHLAQKYYDSLPATDVNKRFFEQGKKYEPVVFSESPLGGIWSMLTINSKLNYLNGFYPHQKVVQATIKQRNM